MTWEERIAHYATAMKFPVSMAIGGDGRVFGIWRMGNDYRVSSGYYGGYPATYLRRVKALFPDKVRTLHLFSGHVDLVAFPGDTVDSNADLSPTFVDDAQTLLSVPLEDYDLVLADPAYSAEDSLHYGTPMINRTKVVRALARCRPGTHVVWLDQVLPMYRKDTLSLEAEIGLASSFIEEADIGMCKSTNHRFRVVTIFCRRDREVV